MNRIASVSAGLLGVVLSACIVVGQGTGPSETEPGEVEFELAGPGGAAIVVEVEINDEGPFRFVVDTGATFTCVNRELSERLELPAQTGRTGFGAGIGGSGRIELVRVDSIQVGSASASELTACVVDLQSIQDMGLEFDGLLGLNFLKGFRVGIDFEANLLTLE